MSETSRRYQVVAGTFDNRLAGVQNAQWSAPTPCPEWTVRDLVAHVVITHRRVLATLDGTEPEPLDTSADLSGPWREARDAVATAVADATRAATMVGGMFGEQPFEALVGRLLCADTLVHTWDLARATGQDERLDPDAVTACLAFLVPIDEAIRRPGGFAPKIEPAPGADQQAQLLNFCGRAV